MSNAQATPTIELDASERPIKAVTVFNSHKAEVVRTFKVELNVRLQFTMTKIPSVNAFFIFDCKRRVKMKSTSPPSRLALTPTVHE